MKRQFNNKRFTVRVVLKKEHFPNLNEDLILIDDEEYFTLGEISEKLNLSYANVVNIFRRKSLKCGTRKTWFDCPMSPCITINKIRDEYGN